MPTKPWTCLEPDLDTILAVTDDPLRTLAAGEFAAIVFRQAMPADECRSLVGFLVEEGLMDETIDRVVAEKTVSAQITNRWTKLDLNPEGSSRQRIDVGTSLANFGDDKEYFFDHSAATHKLFDRLFAARLNPVATLYDQLQQIAPGKRVVTAYEPDGRKYGPAIFRIHYGGYTYGPHFDSVRLRENRKDYTVYRYRHQLAAVLCVQNSTLAGKSAQGIVHNQLWNKEVQPYLETDCFGELVAERNIENVQIDLEPGDLYFFNPGMIHEVPGVPGNRPRVVLASFIGYSEDDDEVMVWS